jgi:hypothetical protein
VWKYVPHDRKQAFIASCFQGCSIATRSHSRDTAPFLQGDIHDHNNTNYVQEYLLKICINKSKEAYKYTPSRRLLAKPSSCPEGKEPLWSSGLIHKVHILIFLIAMSHILYAMATLFISMRAMHRWREFESIAQDGRLLPLPVGQLQHEGETRWAFGLRQAIRQFTHPIDIATYVAIRRMFIESAQACTSIICVAYL